MAKLKLIIRHEWRLLKADRTAIWMIVLFALAVGGGIFGGNRWTSFQRATIANLQREESERYNALLAEARETEAKFGAANQTSAENWDPRNPYFIGNTKGPRYAVLPPAPLAVTAIGQSDLLPSYFRVSTDLKQNFAGAYELENPLKLLVGRFDLAFVVIWLYPLLILALSFNLLAGERENGTLALLLSQPVSLRTVVLGKTLVRAATIFAPVVVFAAIGLWIAGVKLGDPGALSRFALWVAAVLLYGAFWFALAALVNARGKSSAANALILAGAWLLFVVLLPSAINVVATTLYPVPSRVEYIQAMREASEGEVAVRSQIMAAFYEDHPELAKGAVTRRDEFTLSKEQLNQRMEEMLRPVAARFEQQLARQQRITGWFRFLTPALLAQEVLHDVAGTGQARYQRFTTQVDEFHRAWRDYFYPRIARRELVSCDDFAGIPRYQFREEEFSRVIGGISLPFLALAGMAALIGMLARSRAATNLHSF